MWLYVPSHSAPAKPDWNSDSTLRVLDALSRHVTWNGSSSPPGSLLRVLKREPCLQRLSGLMCEQSALQKSAELWAASTPSPAATPASHSPSPASSVAKTIRDTYGQPLLMRLRAMSRACVFSRTSAATLLSDSIPFSLLYERWATALRRACLRRRKRVLLTSVSGCSSWPTADANVMGDGTSRSGDRKDEPLLDGQARNWGTPRVTTNGGIPCPEHTGRGSRLEDQAAVMWQTPHGMANTDKTGKKGGAGGGECALPANQWATPQTFDASDCQTSPEKRMERKTKGGCRNLREEAVQDFPSTPPAPPTEPPGQESSPGGQGSPPLWPSPCAYEDSKAHGMRPSRIATGRKTEYLHRVVQDGKKRLNPNFVTLLMNFPLGWPDPDRSIAPSNCGCSAMHAFRRKSRQRLLLWLQRLTSSDTP